ncbi:hypothetical protein COX08_00105 [Candidatus Beckwithbacteria bacterium CG23_combo_of_CG06-09_8_20_14_all_34_8]|uniref:DUF4274 domain-containing protein n=1 Tax=Candidatus Beckwithbacteria bacterium CG23_combo_of_CG06-09_8_20_14_all_34_8 TaxID=1974497 RepID=A0A2H0B7F1_9BACT|nr:MAG: hypothetical protein COX08_00105 [Candidatus Beckwithbacteria bacterium CG23_combo_of_CG06-09_8_20_14_all_34_8]
MTQLTKSEIKRVKRVLNDASVKILKSPLEKHQLLLHWNFDDGIKPWQYLVDQSDTDLGTIVLLYWLLGPKYVYQDIKKSNNSDQVYVLIKKIETNIKTNFYMQQTISVDPSNIDKTNYLIENKPILKQIPQLLTQKTPGESVDLAKLVIEYIDKVYPLTQADWKTLETKSDRGLAVLIEFEPTVTKDSNPQSVIDVLDKFSISKRPQNGGSVKFSRKEINEFANLDLVFGTQLVKIGGWKWYIHELHEQVLDYRNFVLISDDHKYMWHPFGGMSLKFSDRNYVDYINIKNYFQELQGIDAYEKKEIQRKLENYRQKDIKYVNKGDEELTKILINEIIDRQKQVPFYAKSWVDLSHEEIYQKYYSGFMFDLFRGCLPSHVHSTDFGRRTEFIAN